MSETNPAGKGLDGAEQRMSCSRDCESCLCLYRVPSIQGPAEHSVLESFPPLIAPHRPVFFLRLPLAFMEDDTEPAEDE